MSKIRLLARALAEVAMRAYMVDEWIQANVDPQHIEEDKLVDGLPWQSQPWYEMAKVLPVLEDILVGIISEHRDWDWTIEALASEIVESLEYGSKPENPELN